MSATSIRPLMRDLDLCIRTSGERRLSNFLLWQAAYSELLFRPTRCGPTSARRNSTSPGGLCRPRPPFRRRERGRGMLRSRLLVAVIGTSDRVGGHHPGRLLLVWARPRADGARPARVLHSAPALPPEPPGWVSGRRLCGRLAPSSWSPRDADRADRPWWSSPSSGRWWGSWARISWAGWP